MTESSNRSLEVLVDMTRTTQGQGRAAGAMRVESEFASALLRRHPDVVVPVSWSSAEETFLELDRGTAARYLSPDGGPGDEVTGRPLEATRKPDASRRRILLVTGAGWLSNVALLYGLLRARRTLGAELHIVVHDLVHLLFPQWASRDEALRCGSTHEAMLAGADRVLVYSDSTERDIAYAAQQRGLHVPDIGRMALGTAFVAEGDTVSPLSVGLESVADRPFVLYVSTIAARKNHVFIAQVWTRLAAELGARLPRLVLVGRVAPDQEAMMERLSRDPALADHLIHVSGAADAGLAWLYSRCLFTVFPSLYEGWGLPVAESLALGKVCVASNASSIPEVAAGVTPVLDPLDIRAWCDAVRKMVLEPDALAAAEQRVREGYRTVTWPDAADRLWRAITPPLKSNNQRQSLTVTSTPVAQALAPLVTALEPWRQVRTALGAVAAHRTRFGLQLADVPAHGLRLHLSMRTLSSAPMRVETEINGLVTDGCVLEPGDSAVRHFDLPRDVLLRRGLLEVVAVVRPLAGTPLSEMPPISFHDVTTVALSREDEAAALAARRDVWRLGDILHFTEGSRYLALLKRGWGEPVRWGVWTVEPMAAISFRPMPQPSEPIVLRVAVRGFVPPAQPALEVDVLVRGTRLTTWSFRHPSDFSFVERVVVIPPELIVDGIVYLELSIPGSRSPSELGMSQDDRRLGVGLVRAHCTTRSGPQPDADWLRRRRA